MVQLGKLKVSPSPQGLADDVLGKKTLSKTAPLSSIKSPLGKDEYPPLSQKEDPFSKTDSLTRKTVRLADPIESISTKIHEPIPPINSEERSSDNGLVLEEKTEVKPILKDSVDKETLEDIPNSLSPSLESQLNFEDPLPNPDIIETPQDPPLHQKNDESHDIPEKDFRPKETANNVDFDQRTSLQYRETLIRQQHCALSIQNVYSNVLTRSSVNDSLHVAILKGDDKLVEEILMPNDMRAVTAETMNKLMTRDRYGRTCFHIAAHGTNPRIIDILLLISRLYYGELNYREITKLKEERKKCLLDLKSSFGDEIGTDRFDKNLDNYKFLAIENWYEKEFSRIHRKLELEVESAWLSAVSERDSRGMTPIHYCVCSQEYSNSAINCLSVLEALLSPIRGGRGDFFQTDAKSEKNNSSRKKSGKQTIEVKAKRFLTEAIWFQREAIYNSVTGQQVVALQEANNQPLFRSTASPKTSLSSSLTLNRQKLSLSDLTAQYPVDSSLYSSPSDDYSPEKSLKVDYEVIIPWLVRNIYKRASIMGERLGSSPIDILEELVELVDCDFTRTLIVPEIKDLLKSLGIMVTDDIVKELCNMYPGSIEIVQHKWETINRGDTKFIDEDDSDEENQPVEKKSSKGINKGAKMTKQTKQGNSKSSSKSQSLMSDLYDEDETKMADSKETEEKVNKKKMTVKYHPDEEYGLDFNKLVDDIASGKGMKSITSFTSSKKSDTTPPEPIPSNQEDILLDLENATGTHSQLISFDSKLDLPQTLTISTILKYRKYVVNVVDEYSSTPLLLATAMNKRDLVDMLLSMGGDISIASTDGQTPLTVATDHLIISSLQKKLMKLLKSKRTNNGKATTLSDTTSSTMSNSNLFGQKTVREFGLTLTETSIPSRVDEPTTILSQSCSNSYGLLMHLQQLSSKRYGYSKTALSWAVEGGLESIIEQLVHVGANVTASDAMGRTPLHHCVALAAEISADDCSKLEESIAAILKLRSIAEMLLNGGADVNAKTISGRTPLHEMFCRGSDLSSSTIILKRTSLDSCTNSICRAKSLFVRSLLHWGSDPLLQDRHGYSSMHYCARENMTFCLIEILKTDVDYFAPCLRGRNILHLACLHGCEATAEIICKWDADNSENGILLIQDLSGKIPRDLIPKDMNSLCLITLWSACREGNPLRVNQLLNRQKKIKLWDNVEEEQLQAINFEASNPNHRQESFQDLWLLDGVEARTRRRRLTPLHCAVIGWAEASIRATGNMCAKKALGQSSIEKHGKKQKKRSITTFTQKNASHGTVVSILLQNYAYVDSMDDKGRTPLMYAAASNLVDCLQLLVTGQCDLNRIDSCGNTALHYAYGYGSIAAASFLESKGANSDLENNEGKMPLEIAGLVNALPSLIAS